jgi:small subunit ribosomal protein S6
MGKYETLMVLRPELPEAQTRETLDRARRLIEEMGGKVEQVQEWGMRDLAYPIRKQTRGYYVLIEYSSTAAGVNELERNLKIADEILRFLSVVPSSSKREVKPAARAREASDPSKIETPAEASAVAVDPEPAPAAE